MAQVGDAVDVARLLGEVAGGRLHLLAPGPLELALGVLEPGDHGTDALGELVGSGPDQGGQLRHDGPLARQVAQGVDADEGLDAAHPRPDRRLAGDGQRADLARVLHVGATAQLAAPRTTDLDDAHVLVVGLTEQRERTDLPCARQRHEGRRHREVLAHREVRHLLDLAAGRGRERLPPREVQAQVAGLVVRAGLQRRRAEHLAQGGVHHVGARVRLAGREPPLGVDLGEHAGTGVQGAGDDLDGVRDQPLDRPLHVDDPKLHAVGGDDALVGDLAAALGVEGGAVEHDLPALARLDLGHGLAVDDQPDDGGLARELLVGQEVGGAVGPQVAPHLGVRVARLLRLGVGLGPLALLAHQVREALAVDLEPLLGGHLQGQVDREAVGVVQLERLVAREGRPAALLGARHGGVEDRGAGREGAPERLLLRVRDLRDAVEAALQLGVALLHPLERHGQQLGQARVLVAEQPHRAHRAAQHPAQHVATALVAGGDAVADQHQRGAHVVGDDAQPHVVGVAGAGRVAGVLAVALAGHLGGAGDDRVDLVDLVEVVDPLQQGRHPLQAHAGVDVALRQRPGDVEVVLGAHRRELLLHEHQVPELEVAVLVDGRAALGAVLGPAVEVDLAARAAGARHAHVPVVVELAAAGDPRLRDADRVAPDGERLVVVLVDGGPDAVGVQAVAAVGLRRGDQLPGERDGALLEVVAEGEVAVHLEEGAVPRGLADLLDVTGAHALLHAGRPVPRRRLLAQEVRLEGHHAGVDEQQVRVVVDQRRGGDDGVAVLLEERQPATPDLCGFHGGSVLGR